MTDVSHIQLGSEVLDIKDKISRNKTLQNEKSIEDINEKIDILKCRRLKSKKAVLIGDSFLRGTGNIIGQGWGYYLKEYSQMHCEEFANGGAGFTQEGTTPPMNGMTFIEMLEYSIDHLQYDPSDYDYVIIGGGHNDYKDYNDSNVKLQAARDFADKARLLYPNAEIWYFPLHADGELTEKLWNAFRYLHQGFITRSCPTTLLSLFWMIGRTTWGSGDGVHPGETGYMYEGGAMGTIIAGGSDEYISVYNEVTIEDHCTQGTTPLRCYTLNGTTFLSGSLNVSGLTGNASDTNLCKLSLNCAPITTKYVPAMIYQKSKGMAYIMRVKAHSQGAHITMQPGFQYPDWFEYTQDFTVYINTCWCNGQ